MIEPINEDNFLLYCSKHYDGGFLATLEDLKDDLSKIKYIKKLITRYRKNDVLKERLILNHIIVLNNMFGATHTARILYFRLQEDFDVIKPFLIMIGIMPETFEFIGNTDYIDTDCIQMDQKVVTALRKL